MLSDSHPASAGCAGKLQAGTSGRILTSSLSDVLARFTAQGEQCVATMSVEMEKNYRRIQEQMGEEKLATLMELLRELRGVKS